MISLSTPTFDIDGFVSFEPDEDSPPEMFRRVVRARTLDGGVAINDSGYSDGDSTLDYTWQTVSRGHTDAVAYLFKNYRLLTVSTPEGVYLAAPQAFDPGQDESSLTLLVKERLD